MWCENWRKALSTLAVLSLSLALAAACSSGTETPAPGQSATAQTHDEQDTTPPEVLWDGPELTKPNTWNQVNLDAAHDALDYFLQSWPWGLAHKDLSVFKAMSGPECAACQDLIKHTDDCLAEDSSWFKTHPAEFEVDRTKTFPNDPYAFVFAGTYTLVPIEYYCPDEGLITNPEEHTRLIFIVVNSPEGEWYIEGYSGDYEEDE